MGRRSAKPAKNYPVQLGTLTDAEVKKLTGTDYEGLVTTYHPVVRPLYNFLGTPAMWEDARAEDESVRTPAKWGEDAWDTLLAGDTSDLHTHSYTPLSLRLVINMLSKELKEKRWTHPDEERWDIETGVYEWIELEDLCRYELEDVSAALEAIYQHQYSLVQKYNVSVGLTEIWSDTEDIWKGYTHYARYNA